jgi:hypothetical protein
MATIKKLYFVSGTDTTAPTDLSFESSTNHLEVYANDAGYVAINGAAVSGDMYLNSTLNAPRAFLNSAWRTGVMTNAGADATKAFAVDTSTSAASTTCTIQFAGSVSRTYTFPDLAGTVIVGTGSQTGSGALSIGASVGANTITIGGATSTVSIAGDLSVEGTTTTFNTQTVQVEDSNIMVNYLGNDATSEGAGLEIDRTGTHGSLKYATALASKFKIGALGAESEVADVSSGQTLTNKTISGASNTITNIALASQVTGVLPANNGGTGISNNVAATLTRTGNFDLNLTTSAATALTLPTSGTVATIAGVQVISNKDYQGGVASNTNRMILPSASLATLNTLTNVEGGIAYATDTDALYTNDGVAWNAITGGGGSSTVTVTQASHGFTTSNIGAPLYISTGGVYTLCIATASNTSEVQGLISSINNVNSFILLIGDGVITVDTAVSGGGALVVGSTYFVSAATAGQITATEPTTIGNVSKPLGTATSTTVLQYQPGLRGIVVGGTNALTTIAFANNATSNIQSVSSYQGGELSGYVSISATSSVKFFVKGQFSKNAAGTDYNLSYQTSGETPPASFVMSVTAAGLIQITIGALAGHTASSITFGLSVPSVGATFPLSISARNVIGDVSGTAVPANYIGEYREVISTGYVSMSNNVYSDGGCAGILLPIGTWDVHTTGAIVPNTTTTLGYIYRFVGTASGNSGAGIDDDRNLFGSYHGGIDNSNGDGMYGSSPPVRIDVSTPTMYYAKIRAGFAVSTCQGKASIFARRAG